MFIVAVLLVLMTYISLNGDVKPLLCSFLESPSLCGDKNSECENHILQLYNDEIIDIEFKTILQSWSNGFGHNEDIQSPEITPSFDWINLCLEPSVNYSLFVEAARACSGSHLTIKKLHEIIEEKDSFMDMIDKDTNALVITDDEYMPHELYKLLPKIFSINSNWRNKQGSNVLVILLAYFETNQKHARKNDGMIGTRT